MNDNVVFLNKRKNLAVLGRLEELVKATKKIRDVAEFLATHNEVEAVEQIFKGVQEITIGVRFVYNKLEKGL